MFSRTIPIDKRAEKIATHQRLVLASRRQLSRYLPAHASFPKAGKIVHFEGVNGPDGLASKRSAGDEPYQFIKPGTDGGKLIRHIKHHLYNLNRAYKKGDEVKMAFEAAWMSHMMIDGLTPAHQQPFKDQLKELDDREMSEVNSRIMRIISPGDGPVDFLVKNWKRLGPGGVGTNHMMFEAGVDFLVMPLHPRQLMTSLSRGDVRRAKSGKFIELYLESVNKVAKMEIFERYVDEGWTAELARDVREVLLPEIVRCVTLGWIAGIYSGK